DRVQPLTITLVALLLITLVIAVAIRYIPSSPCLREPWVRAGVPLLLALSIVVDVAIAGCVASGTTVVIQDWLGLHGLITAAVIVGAVLLVYVGATRGMIGGTAGE